MISDISPTPGDDPGVVLERRIDAAKAAWFAGDLRRAARAFRVALALVDSADALRGERGRVCHHLCAMYGLLGDEAKSGEFYRAALRAYPRDHQSIPALQNDSVAAALVRGDYTQVAVRLEQVRDAVVVPCAAATIYGNLAVAYAATGRVHEARILAGDVERLAESLADPWAWACLARVSYAAGDSLQTWRTKAERARRLASAQGDTITSRAMRELLA